MPGQFAGVIVVGGARLAAFALSKSMPGESTATKLFESRTDCPNCMLVELVGGVALWIALLQVAIACSPAELATYTNGPEANCVTSVLAPPLAIVCGDSNEEST